jgi:hypothetical protein
MAEIQHLDDGFARLYLRNTLEGVLEDVTELLSHLKVTADELIRVREGSDEYINLRLKPTKREWTTLLLDQAKGVAEYCLAEIDSQGEDAVAAIAIFTSVAQFMVTRAAGQCLGVELARGADAALMQRAAGSEGGRKGAQTRQAKAIKPESVVAAAKELGWPDKKSGINKLLSKQFPCDPDHIGRILRNSNSGLKGGSC